MANFKGGFAFNNEAAKVEVEQAPDGTLISCVNPVTGEGLNAGNYSEVITGTLAAPFGDYEMADILSGLFTGDLSIMLTADASALGITDPIIAPLYSNTSGTWIIADGASFHLTGGTPDALISAFRINYNLQNNSQYLAMYQGGTVTDATAYMSVITTSITIYHHTMPE